MYLGLKEEEDIFVESGGKRGAVGKRDEERKMKAMERKGQDLTWRKEGRKFLCVHERLCKTLASGSYASGPW